MGLRGKLVFFSFALAVAPLVAIWPVGLVEDFLRHEIAWEIDLCIDDFIDEESTTSLDPEETDRSGADRGAQDADADADEVAGDGAAWIHRFAEQHHVMIRILDEEGQVVTQTIPRHAERWASVRGLWQGLDDIFYGPVGPPDLLAFEARLPDAGSRPEVLAAMNGRRGTRWRYDGEARMFVLSAAAPLPDGEILYVTRVSRRVIRSLYDMRYQLLKLTLFLAVAAILFGLYIGRRIVSPLIKMERAIEAYLKRPQKSTLDSLALKGEDEIGDLSRSFQELTARLHHQVEEGASVAGDLAHDLKNPIATVAASAELLESSASLDEERQVKLANALTSAAEHMRRSVEGMLDLAHLDERLASTEHLSFDLASLLSRVVDDYRLTPQCEGLLLELDIPTEGVELVGSEAQMEQLIKNLLDNAIVFCEQRVEIALIQASDTLRLTISDDGPGVSKGNRTKIFGRFFSSRPEGSPEGTGLGLSIVSNIATALGGRVELLPSSVDHLPGARFVVTLPIA